MLTIFIKNIFIPKRIANLDFLYNNLDPISRKYSKSMLNNLYKQFTGETLSYKDETFNSVYDLLKNRSTETSDSQPIIIANNK